MDARKQFGKCLLLRRLLILIPVHIGEAPKHRLIAHLLGHALLSNFDFRACSMTLVGAFDVSPELIGQKIGAYVVDDLEHLPAVVEQTHPEIAVLCVPRNHAQSMAEHLVSMGIRGIWNFTNHELNLPSQVKVENVVFQDSLLLLGYKLKEGGEA